MAEVEDLPPANGLLTFRFENKSPVALDDLSLSLNALAQSYEDYLAATGKSPPVEGVKLYVHDLRTGSVIAVLKAIADQGRLLFGEHGVVTALQSTFDHADTIAGFLGNIDDVVKFFLGTEEGKPEPTRKEAEQMIRFLEPVAKDSGSQVIMQFLGPTHIGVINNRYDSQQANAVQNSARRYLGPTLPTNQIMHDELLTLHQVRGDTKSKTGDKGVIESISKAPVKLWFTSEQIKKDILESPDNPFQQIFVVDVEVKTADRKPALYKVLALKGVFERR